MNTTYGSMDWLVTEKSANLLGCVSGSWNKPLQSLLHLIFDFCNSELQEKKKARIITKYKDDQELLLKYLFGSWRNHSKKSSSKILFIFILCSEKKYAPLKRNRLLYQNISYLIFEW